MRGSSRRIKLLGTVTAAVAAIALSIFPSPAPDRSVLQSPPYLATALSEPDPLSARLFSDRDVAQAAAVPTNSSNLVYVRQTGHYLRDAFLNYWLMHGGVAIYGYPISEEFEFGGLTVQYFERSRFEYRPESGRPWKVELTHVGTLLTAGRSFGPASQTWSDEEVTYFEETGHTLRGAFADFWNARGGLPIFGYPISEEILENGRTVQYFEKARMELLSNGRVQLGHVGAELLRAHLQNGIDPLLVGPMTRPGYAMSFRGEATVFNADWERVIRLNKSWGNLPQDYVGQGLYAAAPADLGLYGRWARVTRGNRSIYVQFIDVINWPDIPYVRNRGIVIDLGRQSFQALGNYRGGRYEVSFDVFWPGEGPDEEN